jgi:hypothetical protein
MTLKFLGIAQVDNFLTIYYPDTERVDSYSLSTLSNNPQNGSEVLIIKFPKKYADHLLLQNINLPLLYFSGDFTKQDKLNLVEIPSIAQISLAKLYVIKINNLENFNRQDFYHAAFAA